MVLGDGPELPAALRPVPSHRRRLYRTVRLGGRARGGLVLLVTWAICSGLLAFFADDIEGTPQHGSGIVHLVLAFIAFTAIAIGAILISARLMSDPAWRPAAPVLLAISVAGAIAYLLLGTVHSITTPPAAFTSASSLAWNCYGSASPPSPSPGAPTQNE